MSPGKSLSVVCFANQAWEVCRTTKHHLMTQLARRGHRVLFVDPHPIRAARHFADGIRSTFPVLTRFGLQEIEPRLWVHGYYHSPWLTDWMNHRRRRWVLRRVLRQLGMSDSVSVIFLPHQRWLSEGIHPAATIYFAEDEYTAFGGLERVRDRIRRHEEELLQRSQLALAVSPRLVDRLRQLQPRTYFMENAVDPAHYASQRLAAAPQPPAMAKLPHPRIGFVGQIDERMDQSLLLSIAEARPQWQIVLVGRVKEGVDVSALAARQNVHLVGFQPYEALPGAMAGIDVCVVPYHLTLLTHSCNPMKVYEYLATGRPVIATPLEGLNACREVITIAASPEEWIAAIERALADPAAGREQRLAVAAEHTWERRGIELEQRLFEAIDLARQPRQVSDQPNDVTPAGAGVADAVAESP